ncbi:MAG: hypothetical protein VKK80_09520 [Prochlorothrix sp.]|nr:hypothetical protein [Prochlorothrix sp.]
MASTPEEVWQLLGELVQAQKETDRRLKELGEETDRHLKELSAETDRHLKELSAETDRKLQEFAQEADRRSQEADRRSQEVDRQLQELSNETKELGKQVKELGRQIGGLGAKFGSFTEGMAYPAMSRILQEQFGMDCVGPRVRRRYNGQEIEIDVLAYANGDRQAVYIVEVKSHPREESIEQMRRLLQRFPDFFPEHRDKALYGILAAVDVSASVREQFLAEGLYVARIDDEVFALDVPEEFQPRSWAASIAGSV